MGLGEVDPTTSEGGPRKTECFAFIYMEEKRENGIRTKEYIAYIYATKCPLFVTSRAVYFGSGNDLSNSAFPDRTVAYRMVVLSEAAMGALLESAISLISCWIFLETASWTEPGGLSAISLTSLSVSTSLMREARDWISMVVGPSKRRKS